MGLSWRNNECSLNDSYLKEFIFYLEVSGKSIKDFWWGSDMTRIISEQEPEWDGEDRFEGGQTDTLKSVKAVRIWDVGDLT